MFAASFVQEVKTLSGFTGLGLHDKVDRLNTIITPIILGICLTIVGSSAFYLRPLDCFLSAPIAGSNVMDYVKDYCWVHGTIPLDGHTVSSNNKSFWKEADKNDRVVYYQWMPFFLGLMALMFYIPYYFWAALSHNRVGTDFEMIISLAHDALTKTETDAMDKELTKAADGLYDMLCFKRKKRNFQKIYLSQASVFYRLKSSFVHTLFFNHTINRALVVGYFVFKLMVLFISLLELFLLAKFLDYKNSPFFTMGFDLAGKLAQGLEWETTKWFPRVSFCVLRIRMLGADDNQYLAQCALSVNMVNEKICIFLALWMFALVPINAISLCLWLFYSLRRSSRREFVKRHLKKVFSLCRAEEEQRRLDLEKKLREFEENGEKPNGEVKQIYVNICADLKDEKKMDRFACTFLKQDGVFVLRMIQNHVGTYVCGRLLFKLWLKFMEDKDHGGCACMNEAATSRHPDDEDDEDSDNDVYL